MAAPTRSAARSSNLSSTAPPGSSGPLFRQRLNLKARGVRFVKFQVLSNHNGVTYPASASAPDNAFAGLSEVQFFAAEEVPQNTVKV